MPLLDTGTTIAQGGSTDPKPALMFKVPEHIWQQLGTAALTNSRVKVSLDGGISLLLHNGDQVTLQAHTTGAPTEIHRLDSSTDSLSPIALASARLSAPITAKVGDKAKAPNGLPGKINRPNGLPAKPIAAIAATGMSRTQSSPAGPTPTPAPTTAAVPAPSTPVVPLKTRVVQLLALGPCEETEMMQKVGGVEADVMRVVNVVGRKTSTSPPTYELQPTQYSKIKIGGWKYSNSEKRIVIERARKAFDELKLPPDADERVEMDKKEAEALSSSASSSSNSVTSEQPSQASASSSSKALPSFKKNPLPPKPKAAGNGNDSDVKSTKAGNGANKKSTIGRQLDKFRAERRTASLPNGKRENGASPRLSDTTPLEPAKAKPVEAPTKTTREEAPKKAAPASRRRSRDYTSSEESDDEESLPTPKKTRLSPKPQTQAKRQVPPSSPMTELTDDDSVRGRPSKRPSPPPPRRKSPPAELNLVPNGHVATPSKTPDEMRERYEELYPAYQQLTQKLMVVYQDAEDAKLDEGTVASKEEVDKMVTRWQKWHTELEGIRACFGEDGI